MQRIRKYCLLLLVFLAFLAAYHITYAETPTDVNMVKLFDYLTVQKKSLNEDEAILKAFSFPRNETEYHNSLHNIQSKQLLNEASIQTLRNFILHQKELEELNTAKLKALRENLTKMADVLSGKKIIDTLTERNEATEKLSLLLEETLKRALIYQQNLEDTEHQLTLWYAQLKMQQKRAAIQAQETTLQTQIKTYLDKGIALHRLITQRPQDYELKITLLMNEQQINILQYQLTELMIQKRLAKMDFLLAQSPDIKTLQTVSLNYQQSMQDLQEMVRAYKKMSSILTVLQKKTQHQANVQVFTKLQVFLHEKIAQIEIQEQTLQEDLENQKKALKQEMATRHSLFENQQDTFSDLLALLMKIPLQCLQYIKNIVWMLYEYHHALHYVAWGILGIIWCSITTVYIISRKRLNSMVGDKARRRITGHIYDLFFYLLNKNIGYIALVTGLLSTFKVYRIPFATYQLLINILLLWMFFNSMIWVVRRLLLERLSDDVSGEDVRLYHRLKWLIIMGGSSVTLLMVSYFLPLAVTVQDIFNRIFMLFLLVLSLVMLKSRIAIMYVLTPYLIEKKKYIQNSTWLLMILVPLTLFITAGVGLSGYINLAWTMSRFQLELLAILALYIIVRGILTDLFEMSSDACIRYITNGWLLTEVIIKPVDKIVRTILIVLACYAALAVFDLQNDPQLISFIAQVIVFPLVNLTGIHITLLSILQFVIVLMIFLWLSKWTREFAYRWLYRNTEDPGIRHSLSVFTQYAVILVGVLTTLRVLGLDFSGMMMIVGGLAVGMGFGLRDFASNIVGGLMLLIERPVREGDLVTIDNYEGRVAHIGIRSMRLSSWDNMEVLIPNAETFSKPFTNWTHQDSIVRTVVPIKIARADCPLKVRDIIQNVLDATPEVLRDPVAQIFLKQIDDALIEFEVRYYINVAIHTRFEVRSSILFSLIAAFKAAGIHAPIPPLQIALSGATDEKPCA